jgi:hypothetical protein
MSLNCDRLILLGLLVVLLNNRAELRSMTELIAITALSGSQNRTCHLSIAIEVRKRPNKVGGILCLSLASIVAHLTEGLLGNDLLVVVELVRHL